MIILNWIPELAILVQIFITLVFLNFNPPTYRSLPLIITAFSGSVLFYFSGRTDLAYFDSPQSILISDSLSYFGRLFSLLILVFGSLSLHLNRVLSYESKQRGSLFLLFLAAFLNTLVLSNSVLLFLIGWMGAYFSATNLILVESNINGKWVQAIRQQSLPFVISVALLICLHTTLSNAAMTPYLSDCFLWLQQAQNQSQLLMGIGGLVVLLGVTLMHGLVFRGRGPLGLAVLNLTFFVVGAFFWFRIGVPFMNLSNVLPKVQTQYIIGLMIGASALRHAIRAIRTTEHDRWLSAMYSAVIGMSWMMIVLPGDKALPAFYSTSLALLVTFFFAGHAFLEGAYKNKVLLLIAIIALVGAPPFELGFQYFRLVHDAIEGGLLVLALISTVVWFGMSVAAIQMLGKIILVKNGRLTFRPLFFGEIFFLALFLICVILLTAYRPAVITLLSGHPAHYLW